MLLLTLLLTPTLARFPPPPTPTHRVFCLVCCSAGARLVEEGLRARFLQRYPDRAHDLAAGDAAAPALAAKHHGGA